MKVGDLVRRIRDPKHIHLDVYAKNNWKGTPLDIATNPENPIDTAETADLIRKHGGKTSEELKAEGK